MNKCYICECTLVEGNNMSIEHIIPMALGGKLKSKFLLCINCNSRFGADIDSALVNQLSIMCNLLNIKREHKNVPNIIGHTTDGKEYVVKSDGIIQFGTRPDIMETNIDNKKKILIKARDKRAADKHLAGVLRKKGLCKNNVNITYEKNIQYLKQPLEFKMPPLGGEKTYRAIAKIAVNYCMLFKDKYSLSKNNIDTNIFEYIINNKNNQWGFVYPYYFCKNDATKIYHILSIHGDCSQKKLYAYVELLSIYKFVVVLNNNYLGRNFSEKYIFDVMNGEEIFINNQSFSADFSLLRSDNLCDFTDEIKICMENILNIVIRKNRIEFREKLIYEGINKALEKIKKLNINDKVEQSKIISEEVVELVAPHLIKGYSTSTQTKEGE